MDVFIKAAEYVEMPVRRTDNEPLQKIFGLVRSELNLDLKNIKQEQAKFWKQHPALVKVTSAHCVFVQGLKFVLTFDILNMCIHLRFTSFPFYIQTQLLIQAQLTREFANLPPPLDGDFKLVLELAPRLLEELMKVR